MNNQWILCIVAGLLWGMAPLVGRLSSVNAMMMTVLIAVGTLVATLPVAFSQNYAAVGWQYLGYGVLGGVLNGVGLLAFYWLVAGSNQGLWNASQVLPISFVIVPIVIAAGSCIFFKEPVTVSKVLGLIFAAFAIYFLNK